MVEILTKFEFKDFQLMDRGVVIGFAILSLIALFSALAWIQSNVVGQSNVIFTYFLLFGLFVFGYFVSIFKARLPQLRDLPFGTIGFGSDLLATVIVSLIGLGLADQTGTC